MKKEPEKTFELSYESDGKMGEKDNNNNNNKKPHFFIYQFPPSSYLLISVGKTI